MRKVVMKIELQCNDNMTLGALNELADHLSSECLKELGVSLSRSLDMRVEVTDLVDIGEPHA
jgi:hypothetical protein